MSEPLVDIAIEALDYIGRATIRAFTDKPAEAAVCQRNIGRAVEMTLDAIDWNFARTFRPGTPLTVTLPPGTYYTFAYEFPSDALRMRRIAKNSPTDRDAVKFEVGRDFTTGNRVVFTEREGAVLVYTARNPDLLYSPPSFRTAAAWSLASKIVGTLRRGEPQWMTKCEQNFRTALSNAATLDANEESPADADADQPDHLVARGYDGPR